jgi:hypothetical protein
MTRRAVSETNLLAWRPDLGCRVDARCGRKVNAVPEETMVVVIDGDEVPVRSERDLALSGERAD